jgi:hypothetical protein
VTTLRDLGVPGLVGTVLGAGVAAWAQARGGKHSRDHAVELLVVQGERQAEAEADRCLAALERAVHQGQRVIGTLHNEWQDSALAPAPATLGTTCPRSR